jgi:uncharacterized membrane protein (UPF0127 family)
VIWTQRTARATAAAAVALALVAAGAGCSSGDGGSDAGAAGDRGATGTTVAPPSTAAPGTDDGPLSRTDLARWSGQAEAVVGTGADLDEPPGPAQRTRLAGFGETAVSVEAADGTVTGCCVLVAVTSAQRERGLMEVTDLGGYTGMLFVWNKDASGGFWMRNTPTPLSIAWFDAEGGFVSSADMAPCDDTDDCPSYDPTGPYRFALEVPEGGLDEMGIGPGSRIAVGGECAGDGA